MDVYNLLFALTYYGDFTIYTKEKGMHLKSGEFEYNGSCESYEEAIFNGILFLIAKHMAKEMIKTGK